MQIDVGQQRRDDRPLRRSRRGRPSLHVLHDVLPQEAFYQRQNASVADLFRYPRHQPVVRDRVEVALQVGVHHMGVTFLQQPVDLPQRVLAAAFRTEAVAAFPELRLKDRFNRHLERLGGMRSFTVGIPSGRV
jgi:hypothetical protein